MMTGDRVIQSDAVVGTVRFSGDGALLAGLCMDSKLRVWDAKSGELKRTQAWEKSDKSPSLTADGTFSAVAADGSVKFWNATTGQMTKQTKPLALKGGRLGVAPDLGKFAGVKRTAETGIDETMHVWDADGKAAFTAPAGFGGVAAMAFSPSGATLISASYDTDVRAWSARNGELLRLIDELTVAMFAAEFSPDEKLLALAGADRTIYLYDTRTWKLARKIAGQPEMISSLAFSPDGRRIATGGFDVVTQKNPVSVIVWDAATGAKVRTMPAPHRVGSVAFAPDGLTVANVNGDKTVSLWAVPKG